MKEPPRCHWAGSDPVNVRYHDREWGVPVYRDRKLFEFLLLEGAQPGLSWITILKRRAGYRKAFDGFDPEKVARYTPAKRAALMKDSGIIRNRLKVESAVLNARAFLKVQEEFGSFNRYQWDFVDGKPVVGSWKTSRALPARTALSDAFSKDLRKRGFKFVGSTIIYAYMQAIGIVNDHELGCFRRAECRRLAH